MKYVVFLSLIFLPACLTTKGNYTVSAILPDGTAVPTNVMAQGSGIYTARNAFCQGYPGATVVIIDAKTGQNYDAESPYQCSN